MGYKAPVLIAQSLTRKIVVILGTEYAGEMKKSIFYAMNYDMPEQGVFPMHCSCNVDRARATTPPSSSASRAPARPRSRPIPTAPSSATTSTAGPTPGVFNFEGGCYAKCIKLSKDRRARDLERHPLRQRPREHRHRPRDPHPRLRLLQAHREHPRHLPRRLHRRRRHPQRLRPPQERHLPHRRCLRRHAPSLKLSPEQAMYYFINGYTSKLAGTEAGVTEPQPNFSPCFGGVFLPRPPISLRQAARRQDQEHGANVWLLNTGWTGGPYGTGQRFKPQVHPRLRHRHPRRLARQGRLPPARPRSSASTSPRPSRACPARSSCPATPGRTAPYDAQAKKLARAEGVRVCRSKFWLYLRGDLMVLAFFRRVVNHACHVGEIVSDLVFLYSQNEMDGPSLTFIATTSTC
jgi:phosphoenolpyruvate carboxykinase (ATP)